MSGEQNSLKMGDVLEVEGLRLNDDGDAVVQAGGLTVFVPGLLPGERATVRVTAVEKRFARAVLMERREVVHPHRITPACSVFGRCGGCQLQHLDYAVQLDHKRDMVIQALRRFGKFTDVVVKPTLGMQEPWRYRNQVQVPLRYDPTRRRYQYGFFASSSHQVVETDECWLESEPVNAILTAVVDVLTNVMGQYAPTIHHLILRQSITSGEMMAILSVTQDTEALTHAALDISRLPGVVSVAKTVQPRPHGPVWGRTVDVLQGKPYLTEMMQGLEFLISPRSFFQVNTSQADILYREARERAQVTREDTVLDAFCGTGTMSLLFARQAKSVVGMESIAAAVEDARRNAGHNGITNATFLVGDVERLLPKQAQEGTRYDIVVLDPPRKGCEPDVLRAILEMRPRRVVYVSCNHITLARDLRILADGGYAIGEVQPVDMFPQTSHVECVVATYRVDKE